MFILLFKRNTFVLLKWQFSLVLTTYSRLLNYVRFCHKVYSRRSFVFSIQSYFRQAPDTLDLRRG